MPTTISRYNEAAVKSDLSRKMVFIAGSRAKNRALKYLKERFPTTEATQIFLEAREAYVDKDGIRSQSAAHFLASPA